MITPIHSMKTVFGSMKIRNKLIAVTTTLILIPTVILILSFFLIAQNLIRQNQQEYITDTVAQTANNIDDRLNDVKSMLYDISIDAQIQEDLPELNKELSESQTAILISQIKMNIHYDITKNNHVKAVYITTNSSDVIKVQQEFYNYPNDIPYEDVTAAKGGNVWGSVLEEYDVIPVYKEIHSLLDQKVLGVITLYIDKDYITAPYSETTLSNSDSFFLLDSENEAIDNEIPEEILEQIDLAAMESESGIFSVTYGDQKLQLVYQELDELNWKLIYLVQDSSQNKQLLSLCRSLVTLFTLIVCILTFVCIKVSNTISKPLVKLTNDMKKVSEGNYHIKVRAKYNDEIGILRTQFNQMVENTNKLIERLSLEESLKYEAQIKALQIQMNPHFFYNTLDTINWLALEYNAVDISSVTQSFGRLMRFSLKDERMISFEEEFSAVEDYMIIQSFRYGDTLALEQDVDEAVMYEYTPRNILLPFIENAIEHGLSDIKGLKIIILRGRIVDKHVVIQIIDNGKGMSENQIQQIWAGSKSKGKHMKIGIMNVQQRLKLLYGEQADVVIKSKIEVGTEITILIPVIEKM